MPKITETWPDEGAKLPVLGKRNLIESLAEDFAALGSVGEFLLQLTLYIVATSRLLADPLGAIVHGKSGSGKSRAVMLVAGLFPPDEVVYGTRITPQALYHLPSLAHKFVVGGERTRMNDDAAADATAALRQLQSEKRIVKQVAERGEDGRLATRTVEQTGPVAFVETTTLAREKIFAEDLNRNLWLTTDESPEQTRRILQAAAARYQEPRERSDVDAIVERHREFQAGLERLAVVIPFASQLMELVPVAKVDVRRVAQQILSMIEAVTLLHQGERERDTEGRLIAEAADYEMASRVLRQPLVACLGPPTAAAPLYESLAAAFALEEVFTTAAVQKLDKADERTVRGRLAELKALGCVAQVSPSQGPKPATWRLTGRTPDDAVLPSAAALGLKTSRAAGPAGGDGPHRHLPAATQGNQRPGRPARPTAGGP